MHPHIYRPVETFELFLKRKILNLNKLQRKIPDISIYL